MNINKLLFFVICSVWCLGIDVYASSPKPWQIWTQDAATPVMAEMTLFHGFLLIVITVILVFVFCLLGYVLFKFSAKRNKTPSSTSHNTILEVVWTLIPCFILIIIAVPSFKLLYYSEIIPKSDLTLKVVGHQWYWSYEYPDHSISFDSNIIQDEDLKSDDIRLLSVDNKVVLPIDTTVRIQVTASDVIHSWAVPAFGIKKDAVPGRLNEMWVNIKKVGVYYGQCSELCGINHGFMPIVVEAVSMGDFKKWLNNAKKEFSTAANSIDDSNC